MKKPKLKTRAYQNPPPTPPPAPSTISLVDHFTALFRAAAERAMDMVPPYWTLCDLCQLQQSHVDSIGHEFSQLLSTDPARRPFIKSTALGAFALDLNLVLRTTEALRTAQESFFGRVDRLNDLYGEMAEQLTALEAFKIAKTFAREAEQEVSWYSESWSLVLRRWVSVNKHIASLERLLRSSEEFKLAI